VIGWDSLRPPGACGRRLRCRWRGWSAAVWSGRTRRPTRACPAHHSCPNSATYRSSSAYSFSRCAAMAARRFACACAAGRITVRLNRRAAKEGCQCACSPDHPCMPQKVRNTLSQSPAGPPKHFVPQLKEIGAKPVCTPGREYYAPRGSSRACASAVPAEVSAVHVKM